MGFIRKIEDISLEINSIEDLMRFGVGGFEFDDPEGFVCSQVMGWMIERYHYEGSVGEVSLTIFDPANRPFNQWVFDELFFSAWCDDFAFVAPCGCTPMSFMGDVHAALLWACQSGLVSRKDFERDSGSWGWSDDEITLLRLAIA